MLLEPRPQNGYVESLLFECYSSSVIHRYKEDSFKMAKKLKRRAWTSADIRTLKLHAKKKARAGSIARTLKRTEGATRQKAFSLGVSLDSRA
jgi:hypothetical protein